MRNVRRDRYELIFVTRNRHKFMEVSRIAEEFGLRLKQYDKEPKLELQHERQELIVLTAASTALLYVNKPLIIEDSGLYIKYLNGFPGPYSSFVFKRIGNEGILKLMEGVDDRGARFVCIAAFAHPEYGIKLFRGYVDGVISRVMRGSSGFGFDPIFIPKGCSKTFAEMDVDEKNRYSHRSKAFKHLFEWLVRHLNLLY